MRRGAAGVGHPDNFGGRLYPEQRSGRGAVGLGVETKEMLPLWTQHLSGPLAAS